MSKTKNWGKNATFGVLGLLGAASVIFSGYTIYKSWSIKQQTIGAQAASMQINQNILQQLNTNGFVLLQFTNDGGKPVQVRLIPDVPQQETDPVLEELKEQENDN